MPIQHKLSEIKINVSAHQSENTDTHTQLHITSLQVPTDW